MTVFLCVLTLLALCASPSIKHGSTVAVVLVFTAWIVMVLGLATLAAWTWSQP